jgi:hypothetical protein
MGLGPKPMSEVGREILGLNLVSYTCSMGMEDERLEWHLVSCLYSCNFVRTEFTITIGLK